MEEAKTERSRVDINGEEEDDEQVDRKVEEFFALIKSFKEASNRRKTQLLLEENEEKKKKKMRRSNEGKSSWVPCFEWEDFSGEIQFRTPDPVILPLPSCNHKQEHHKHQQEDDVFLDLKLAL